MLLLNFTRNLCTTPSQNSGPSTVDQAEVIKFQEIAQYWWDESGEFAALHTLNGLRIPLIRDALAAQDRKDGNAHMVRRPLIGKTVLDVGCGGGILSEVSFFSLQFGQQWFW